MRDVYLLAAARAKELELRRQAGWAGAPGEAGPTVSRSRVVLARWLLAAARRLWPEVGRAAMGGVR